MSSSSDQIFNICLPKVGAESFFIFTLVFVSKDSKDRILKQLSEVEVVQKHLKVQSSAVYLSILFVPSFTLMGVSKSSFFFFSAKSDHDNNFHFWKLHNEPKTFAERKYRSWVKDSKGEGLT